MGKPSKRDDQYKLPLDPPPSGSSDQVCLSNSQKSQDEGNYCKVFNFASAVQKRESKREDEVLQRILAHSEALEW
ncbi:hypothetical protein SYK_22240 [Pseudodesulfovibrio nedwellii]|uniref:Uncharacterized protein n=1 Tax=Pseudodesulfovibrio nedwellii TaxID=2973072 RepID=A0ABN6S3R1_9BACT|nr:hypothetical protein SYK_22240 [Pseudodesulfovibrio nedwellii]